jgi:hypothetical protein
MTAPLLSHHIIEVIDLGIFASIVVVDMLDRFSRLERERWQRSIATLWDGACIGMIY